MSKSEDTKQLILDTAKKEFMEKGYNDASVRSIAKQAGLTTGAIFRYFPDKESLFAALVSPVADHMLDLYRKGGERGFASLTDGHPENMWNISDEVISVLVEYIFANKDAFYLLISQSAGSAYESFVDQLIEEEEKQTYAFQQEMIRQGYSCRPLTLKYIFYLAHSIMRSLRLYVISWKRTKHLTEYISLQIFSVVHGNCILRKEVFFCPLVSLL